MATLPFLTQEPCMHSDLMFVAVGQAVGYLGSVPVSSDSPSPPAYWIRCGSVLHAVTGTTYKLWLRLRVPQSRSVAESASPDTVTTFVEDWDALAEIGLILPLPLHNPDDDLWTHLRLVPAGFGVGQDPEDPTLFAIMLGRDLPVRFCLSDYLLWVGCDGCATLSEVITRTATNLNEERQVLAARLPAFVPAALAAGVGYFDLTSSPP